MAAAAATTQAFGSQAIHDALQTGFRSAVAGRDGDRNKKQHISHHSTFSTPRTFPTDEIARIDHEFRENHTVIICASIKAQYVIAQGVVLRMAKNLFPEKAKMDRFLAFFKEEWTPFAADSIYSSLKYGFIPWTIVPHREFGFLPKVVDIPSMKIEYEVDALRNFRMKYTSILQAGGGGTVPGITLIPFESAGLLNRGAGVSTSSSSSEGGGADDLSSKKKRKAEEKKTEMPIYTFFTHKPSHDGKLNSVMRGCLRSIDYAEYMREQHRLAAAEAARPNIYVMKEKEKDAPTIMHQQDMLKNLAPGVPSGVGAMRDHDPSPAAIAASNLAECKMAADKLRGLGFFPRSDQDGLDRRLRPGENIAKQPESKAPASKMVEIDSWLEEAICEAFGIPRMLFTHASLNRKHKTTQTGGEDSADVVLRSSILIIADWLRKLIGEVFDLIYGGDQTAVAMSEKRRILTDDEVYKANEIELVFHSMIDLKHADKAHDMGLLSTPKWCDIFAGVSGIPRSDLRDFPIEPRTFTTGYPPPEEETEKVEQSKSATGTVKKSTTRQVKNGKRQKRPTPGGGGGGGR